MKDEGVNSLLPESASSSSSNACLHSGYLTAMSRSMSG